MRRGLGLALILLLSTVMKSKSTSPPGKPVLLSCRSPEKESFTCWWEPGFDGGLTTLHRLYYERERLEGVHECPDYQSAGRNSCFFDKNHTSIWVDYYLTVVASNALGNATSNPFKMDVMEIVKPNTPENLTVQVLEREESPYLHIQWKPPYNTDTRSGWVTIKYELRLKQENNMWKEYMSGTQTHFNLYSVSPGVVYGVQVRCRLDHGSWSEWSNTTYVKVHNYIKGEKYFWILVSILPTIPFIAALCILVMKRTYVRQCVLPPVPGPKIRGVDFQLIKSGQSEDIIKSLIIHPNFPMMAWKDQMEEYLIVTENDIGVIPDPCGSQKRNKSLIIPGGFHLELEKHGKESCHLRSECEKAAETRNERNHFMNSNKCHSGESLSHMKPPQLPNLETAVRPFSNVGYVDIKTHVENKQEVDVKQVDYSRTKNLKSDDLEKNNLPSNSAGYMEDPTHKENIVEDYSRVKEVNCDNMIVLEQQNVSDFSLCQEKGQRYADCTLQKMRKPYVIGAVTARMCTEPDSGYVDSV